MPKNAAAKARRRLSQMRYGDRTGKAFRAPDSHLSPGETRKPSDLKPHPLSLKVYNTPQADGLDESIVKCGILDPLIITRDNIIISGRRRWAVAMMLRLPEVPVRLSLLTDPLEIEQAVIEYNRCREKTMEERAREFAELKRIETALARQRQRSGKSADGLAGGRGHKKAMADTNLQANLPGGLSQARDRAASVLGISGRTAEKALAVVQYADRTGDRGVLELMEKSVEGAHRIVQARTAAEREAQAQKEENRKRPQRATPSLPPFTPQHTNLWNLDYTGPDANGRERLHPDLVRNLLWLYTRPNDLVVDAFAGSGAVMEVCAWWNEQAGLWPIRCLGYDLKPSRPGIRQNDVGREPHLPAECNGAGLIFLNFPRWRPPRGRGYEFESNLARVGLEQLQSAQMNVLLAARRRLRLDGRVAAVVTATQGRSIGPDAPGVWPNASTDYYDVTAFILYLAERTGLATDQRIIVPLPPPSDPDVIAKAREDRKLIKAYRDLIILTRVEDEGGRKR